MQGVSPSSLKFKISAHIAGWLIFFIAPLLFQPGNEIEAYFTDAGILWSFVLRNLLLMGLFYFNLLYLTPVVLPTKGIGAFALSISFMVVAVSIGYWFIHEGLTGGFDHGSRPGPPPAPPPGDLWYKRPRRPMMLAGPYFTSFLITAVVAAASTLIVLWNNWTQARINEQERTYQKIAAELSVLKLQISPHFLFNTLNNIRWLVRSRSEHAETAVVKLSHLLRYILYQTNRDHVQLDKEIEHLQDYISLQQMRLTNSNTVAFVSQGDTMAKKIVPLLLIPIVENFFKHGDFDKTGNRIDLIVTDNRLIFKTVNTIVKNSIEPEPSESGIGLENVKKRLALHYPDHHYLNYYESEGLFYVNLEVILT
jgi:hypothetical protein